MIIDRKNLRSHFVLAKHGSNLLNAFSCFRCNQREQLTKHDTEDAEAYQEYAKGRYQWNKRTEEGFQQAIKHFQRATAIDAAYALAYAGLADCYNLLGGYLLLSPKESYPLGKAAAARALDIDASLPEAIPRWGS